MPDLIQPKFTLKDAHGASDEWGANCGPAALALVAGMSLNDVRQFLGDFEQKRYTNPTLMFESLRRCGITEYKANPLVNYGEGSPALAFPQFGLARVQWEGPWTASGVPIPARYRKTHWIASQKDGDQQYVFDINCLNFGGWVPLGTWNNRVVPWILEQCVPKANGKWHLTHVIEVPKP